ncbi:hypothetical protein [Stenotrophomonas sp. ATs4]|uniref:hypothetical protein n=1 Tax=Stenotrophomonas sp. ATs4 TaxID=3402766 RepID=UPI003F723871
MLDTEQLASQNDEAAKQLETHPSQDFLIEVLAALALDGLSIPVTLTVGGILVCGETVGGKEYFQKTIDGLQTAASDANTKRLIQETVGQFLVPYENSSTLRIGYIHLKNVTYHSATTKDGIPNGSDAKPMWRGRLSQIDGFHFGRFSKD